MCWFLVLFLSWVGVAVQANKKQNKHKRQQRISFSHTKKTHIKHTHKHTKNCLGCFVDLFLSLVGFKEQTKTNTTTKKQQQQHITHKKATKQTNTKFVLVCCFGFVVGCFLLTRKQRKQKTHLKNNKTHLSNKSNTSTHTITLKKNRDTTKCLWCFVVLFLPLVG